MRDPQSTPALTGSCLARRARPLSWSYILNVLLGHQGFRFEAIGPHEMSWLGAYDYYRNVLGLRAETEILQGLIQLAQSVGWVQPHAKTCWLVERPERLKWCWNLSRRNHEGNRSGMAGSKISNG